MSKIEIRLVDRSRCRAIHLASGMSIETDVPPELGGGGATFSSTDLLSAALGTCIGSSIGPMLEREGIDLEQVSITVAKELRHDSRGIERLTVNVQLSAAATDRQLSKLRAAARTCMVHRSLTPDIDVLVDVSALEGVTGLDGER